MINLNDHIVEIEEEKYVPLKIAQQAVAEVYNFQNYQTKLDTAMQEFKSAIKDINSLTNDIDD